MGQLYLNCKFLCFQYKFIITVLPSAVAILLLIIITVKSFSFLKIINVVFAPINKYSTSPLNMLTV
jgi:hypothetical protein